MSNNGRGGAYEHVFVLGLDGLSRGFLEAPIVRATMRNLHALLDESSTGTLRSTTPPYTAPGWTSITTGVEPDRHGVFSFTDRVGRPVTASRVAVPRVWDYVRAAGGRSVVVNVPLTHPPKPILGSLVSGMPVPPRTTFTWPEALAQTLSGMGYTIDIAVREGSREPIGALKRLGEMTEARGRAARSLARSEPWDLCMVVFVLPDRLGHPWWKYLVPGEPQYETRKGKRLRRAAVRPLRALDEAIGDLLAELPPSTAVVLCSDHGFGPLRGEVFFDVSLARAGLIDAPAAGGFKRTVVALGRSSASTVLPSALRRWTRTRLQHERGDAARQAWTAPAYERGVRLADPADDAVRDRVVQLLQDLRDPAGGPVFRAVRPRDEVFHGPLAEEAPDLICEPSSETIDLHDGLHARDPWVPRDSFAWGTHAVDGVVAVKGVSTGDVIDGRASDITPTALRLLGLDVPGLDGTSLVHPPVELIETVRPPDQGESGSSYSQQQEDEVLDHLRALGYVE